MIVSMELSTQRVYVLFSNGNVFQKTKAQLAAMSGTKAQKIAALKVEVQTAMGDLGNINNFSIDWAADGTPTTISYLEP